jgi:hypothetical protein
MHPHLAEVREADTAVVIAQFADQTNLLRAHAETDLRALDDQLKRQRDQSSSTLADAGRQFKEQEQTLRGQLLIELQAAAAEPDFEKSQKLAQQRDLQIQHDRDALRDELHARKQQQIRDRDAALAELNRRKQMLVFRADTSTDKAQVIAVFQQDTEEIEREFETKDNALRAQLRGGAPIPTSSHAAVAASIQARLDSLERTYQSVQVDGATRDRAGDLEIGSERQTIQLRVQKALADVSTQLNARMEAISRRDYSNDPRVQSKLLNDTLSTIREGFGLNVSTARFVAAFAFAVSLAVEGVLWVGTVWAAGSLVGLFLGLPMDLETELKKNLFATESSSADSNTLFQPNAAK